MTNFAARPSRRQSLALIAGAAVLPISAPAALLDPILAAIERHKLTYRRASECGSVVVVTADWGPEFILANVRAALEVMAVQS